jgi:hypothetical protein
VYKKGEILRDREEDSEVVVLQFVSTRADEYVIKERDPSENRYSNLTAYDFNSRYEYVQPDDAVVRAVYAESLPSDPHQLTEKGRALLGKNADLKVYAFPISRLAKIDE